MTTRMICAAAVIVCLSAAPASALGRGAVYLDGLTYLTQYGPTPDTVQDQLDPSLAPNVSTASGQHMSVWLSINEGDWKDWNDDGEDRRYMTLYESRFWGDFYPNGVFVYILNDPDDSGRRSLFAAFCSDEYCSEYLWGDAKNVFLSDGNWHNLQMYANLYSGTIHMQLDTQDGAPHDFYSYFSGNSFNTPVAGVIWQVGCHNTWDSLGNCDPGTAMAAQITELWVYSGPLLPGTVDVASGAFWYISGQIIRANSLDSTGGKAVFGDYPTIYLRGDDSSFPDGNAFDFSALPNPPVQPWVVGTAFDFLGDPGRFRTAPSDPY